MRRREEILRPNPAPHRAGPIPLWPSGVLTDVIEHRLVYLHVVRDDVELYGSRRVVNVLAAADLAREEHDERDVLEAIERTREAQVDVATILSEQHEGAKASREDERDGK